MKKSFENELLKRQFRSYLKETKGFAQNSMDAYENAVIMWQDFTGNKEFSTFGKQQVKSFKDHLKGKTNRQSQPLSLTYQYHVLRRLRGFFEWLSLQPNFKSKIEHIAIESLALSKKDTRIAIQPNKREMPSMQEVIKVIEAIQGGNEVDRRDRALICFTLLTGARISAIASMPMMAFDPEKLTVDQNPKFGVKTKFSKRIVTTFFPIEYNPALDHFLEWYNYLKDVRGFKGIDPIFPASLLENGEQNLSYQNTGKVTKAFWSNSSPARTIFGKCFARAEVPYYHPHTFRHLVVKEFSKLKLTEEEKKAISQNLGHENTGTTFGSYGYGYIQEERQIDIVKQIKFGQKEVEGKFNFTEADLKEIAKGIKENM